MNINAVFSWCLLMIFACLLVISPNASICAQNPQPYFKNFTTDQGLPSPEVHCILQDSKGYMWFGTDNGTSRFDGYTFVNYSVSDGLNHPVVFGLQEDGEGRIWMRTLTGNLYYFQSGRIYAYEYNHIIQEYNKSDLYALTDFYISDDGYVYADIRLFGVLKIDKAGNFEIVDDLIKPTSNSHQQIEIPSNLESNNRKKSRIDSIFQAINFEYTYGYINEQKEIFIALPARKGVRKYKNGKQLLNNDYTQLLEGLSISYIYQDREGHYWFASLEKGIYYCSNFNIDVYNQANGFANELFTAITFKNDHEIYIGLRSGEVYLLNVKDQQLETLPSNNSETRLFDLSYDQLNKRLWMSGRTFYYLNEQAWEAVVPSSLRKNESILTKKLFLAPKRKILWGAGSKGFMAYNFETQQIVFKGFGAWEKSVTNRTLSVYEDLEGKVWLGNIGGLFHLQKDKLVHAKDPKDLFSIRVEDIAQMSDSTLVVGTKGAGVVLWKGNDYKYISTEDGLNSNMVEHVHVDSQDRIWVGTLSGLTLISDIRDSTFALKPINMAHGLPSNEINVINSINNQLWIGTSKGLVNFEVQDFTSKNAAPILEETLINDQKKHIVNNDWLKSNQNNIQFSFLSIDYALAGKINYRYRLKESSNWTYTKARTANFLSLAPDEYTFEVQAENKNGVWSAPAKISFSIRPPFWKTKLFILIASCSIMALVYLLYKYRINQIIYKTQIERKMDKLERSALKAQMNPHFIFNCLNSIQAFITEGNRKDAADYLAKFAQLIRSTLNFSSAGFSVLAEEIEAIKHYLELEQMRFKNRFQYTIDIEPKLNPNLIRVPNLLVQPFVENAIVHGISSKSQDGLVQLFYQLNENYLEVIIKDNGEGIHRSSKISKGSSGKPHKSVGMSITQRRLELLNQKSHQKGVQIKEIKNQKEEPIGTEVRLKIKILE